MMKLFARSLGCSFIFLVVGGLIGISTQARSQEVSGAEFPDMQIDAGDEFGGDFGFEVGEDMEAFGKDDFNAEGLDPEAAAAATAVAAAVWIAMMAIAALLFFLLVLAAYLLSDALGAIPEEFREIPAWLPWLLLVPFVQIVILIVAFMKVPKSLSGYLASKGDTSMGDCGAGNGLWGAVLYLLGCTFPIGLVLLVMAILKINQAKKIARAA